MRWWRKLQISAPVSSLLPSLTAFWLSMSCFGAFLQSFLSFILALITLDCLANPHTPQRLLFGFDGLWFYLWASTRPLINVLHSFNIECSTRFCLSQFIVLCIFSFDIYNNLLREERWKSITPALQKVVEGWRKQATCWTPQAAGKSQSVWIQTLDLRTAQIHCFVNGEENTSATKGRRKTTIGLGGVIQTKPKSWDLKASFLRGKKTSFVSKCFDY